MLNAKCNSMPLTPTSLLRNLPVGGWSQVHYQQPRWWLIHQKAELGRREDASPGTGWGLRLTGTEKKNRVRRHKNVSNVYDH